MIIDGGFMASNWRNGAKWNREETILALELYCRTSFGKITQSNQDIIDLAQLLGRTPGSVGLKMHNLAHHDPELIKKNISAMAHGSKLDKQIFEEFNNNWTELSFEAHRIKAMMKGIDLEEQVASQGIEIPPIGTTREQLIKARIGQYFFRMSVLNAYGNRCCITGLNKSELLVASHIKPWAISDEITERTNPRNGLCLNSLHDKAFDRGLITIDFNYNIILSQSIKSAKMDQNTKDWFMRYDRKRIELPDKFLPKKDFIEYHNDVIFLK